MPNKAPSGTLIQARPILFQHQIGGAGQRRQQPPPHAPETAAADVRAPKVDVFWLVYFANGGVQTLGFGNLLQGRRIARDI